MWVREEGAPDSLQLARDLSVVYKFLLFLGCRHKPQQWIAPLDLSTVTGLLCSIISGTWLFRSAPPAYTLSSLPLSSCVLFYCNYTSVQLILCNKFIEHCPHQSLTLSSQQLFAKPSSNADCVCCEAGSSVQLSKSSS